MQPGSNLTDPAGTARATAPSRRPDVPPGVPGGAPFPVPGPGERRVDPAAGSGGYEGDIVDEWGRESFPASDPPSNW